MKEARIALVAIVILTVVGSIDAFKASRMNRIFYKTNPVNGFCSLATLLHLDVTVAGFGTFTTRLSTAPTHTSCPILTVRAAL